MITYQKVKEMLESKNEIPYLSISNLCISPRYTEIIYKDFAGEYGELIAITQYLYEHMDLIENEEASQILKSIAIEEMKHIEILGQILKKLGKDPQYINEKAKPWSTTNVRYDIKDFKELMQYNMDLEEQAMNNYRKSMMYTRNINLRKIFDRIILDEKTHKEIFREMI